jgi:glycosyltransferase involved in cell wall biosynthesis
VKKVNLRKITDNAVNPMPEISVVICSHNPRQQFLSRVLNALRHQTLPKDRWELFLIDNASRESLEDSWDLSWHPKGHHALEKNIGLSFARERGIRESSGDVIVFVDDDNVLEHDYLLQVLTIANEWPRLGAWGCGCSTPEFEVLPRTDLRSFLHFLAVFEEKPLTWANVTTCQEAPP